MPVEIRDLCRRADISSKSLLLQVVRQPTDEEMRRFVETIHIGGLTRDEARVARKGKPKKEQGFVYKCKANNQSWSLMLKFRKSQASKADIRAALLSAVDELDSMD
jgi:ParB family chromosome partitioning protein